jgi:hypothetical protein
MKHRLGQQLRQLREKTMKMTVLASILGALMFAGCGDGAENQATSAVPAGNPAGSGIDFADPESVFAAYSVATTKGDGEAIKRVLRPSQREMYAGATGGGSGGYKIIRREDPSPSEVHLHVQFDGRTDVLPHALVRENGNWYIDIEKTGHLIVASLRD